MEIEEIQSILIKNCSLNITKIQQEKRSKEMWYLSYGGNGSLKRIVSYLYKDSPIYLKRKYNIISSLLES